MSKEWIATVAQAEAAAQEKQTAEELAHSRFDAVRARAKAEGRHHHATDTVEFREWIAARHATDTAWGVWAMAMDAKPAG
jgi:hypothetical protein